MYFVFGFPQSLLETKKLIKAQFFFSRTSKQHVLSRTGDRLMRGADL